MTYNLTLVIKSDTKEADRNKIVKSAKDSFGKSKVTEKDWGEKKLAYPIEKQSTGFYVNMIVDGDEIVDKDLEKSLYSNEKVLRHLMLRSK